MTGWHGMPYRRTFATNRDGHGKIQPTTAYESSGDACDIPERDIERLERPMPSEYTSLYSACDLSRSTHCDTFMSHVAVCCG